MKLQKDFTEEITLLQYHAQKLGAILDLTPKCHLEIAGEGIKYAWGLLKLDYACSNEQFAIKGEIQEHCTTMD